MAKKVTTTTPKTTPKRVRQPKKPLSFFARVKKVFNRFIICNHDTFGYGFGVECSVNLNTESGVYINATVHPVVGLCVIIDTYEVSGNIGLFGHAFKFGIRIKNY